MKHILPIALLALAVGAQAKLPAPAPLSDEAKAKAEEAKARAAHTAKVDSFKLCKSMDAAVAHYTRTAGANATKPSDKAPACVDPGPFAGVSTMPAAAAAPVAPAPAVVAPKAPANKS